jgi:hypothetical protein
MTDFGATKTLKARKQHRCDECGRHITVGETYHRHAGVYDGDFFTNASCAHCAVARRIVDSIDNGYYEGYFGGLDTWVSESLWREPWTVKYPDQAAILLRLAACFRMDWRFTGSRELMPVPEYPVPIDQMKRAS